MVLFWLLNGFLLLFRPLLGRSNVNYSIINMGLWCCLEHHMHLWGWEWVNFQFHCKKVSNLFLMHAMCNFFLNSWIKKAPYLCLPHRLVIHSVALCYVLDIYIRTFCAFRQTGCFDVILLGLSAAEFCIMNQDQLHFQPSRYKYMEN
jgi:hypothetical protein